MNTIEAMKLALEVMQNHGDVSVDEWIAAEKALREALAEQPAREWVGLTDENKAMCIQATGERGSVDELIAAIEAKLKEINE
jgi:hypothetical protein